MLDTAPLLLDSDFPSIHRSSLESLQVNLGYLCNLSCTHCHVNAGPTRTELMDRENVDLVIEMLQVKNISTLDLTGGAPEMNPHLRYLVTAARRMGVKVIDRCNLTILFEPGFEYLAEFLAAEKVTIVASLPCYSEENVEKQRGKGVFQPSIDALQHLNRLGYGRDPELELSLVYNPGGASLPPPQESLRADYKKVLKEDYDIDFNDLFTITNMPISRFGSMLISKGLYDDYLNLLKENFSAANLKTVMCRSLISVDWQGFVYDCDFNQMLELPLVNKSNKEDKLISTDVKKTHLKDLMHSDLVGDVIAVADHCYGCTAGQGSSCGGALE